MGRIQDCVLSTLPSPDQAVSVLSCRPSILSDIEFDLIEGTAANLYQTFPNQDVCWMVTCQPVLLVEYIDYILQELGR